ncbi:RNA polymerase sigma factor SigJ [Actinomadura viridis]|uniref:RNA polymerase sigma-70 factor (ECF subfamily) n=1 Tax=Actinomadura viridis TaxID=58110 RepID=A0A931GH00_9ACTN|nr:RNA polymerase sigma factor SigJ [Actinomadura viridis]MBG6086883.1 RNA polymerase sigma-70 factor (ECF subfamily) [Actinomadura viridis]
MTEAESAPVEHFESNRELLFGVAYRILGSVADAEDVVQESWLRWSRVDHDVVEDPQLFLIQISTRLALDRLRRAKARREVYVGPWLPEPLPTGPEIEEGAELADSVSMAMLIVLETLSPLERVVFVLREAFEFSFAEIGTVLGRSEPAVRQLARRARSHVRERRPRFRHDRKVRRQVTERFLEACLGADMEELLDLLAPEVMLCGDGGGQRGTPRVPVRGARQVSRLLVQGVQKVLRPLATSAPGVPDPSTGGSIVDVNGGPAALITADGEPVAVVVLDMDPVTDRITQVWLIANPDKLGSVEGGH